jgi:hypothetical protein
MALKEISDIDNHNALMSHVNDDGDHFSCSAGIFQRSSTCPIRKEGLKVMFYYSLLSQPLKS